MEQEPKELLSHEVPFLLFPQIWHFVKSIRDQRSKSVYDSLLLPRCVLAEKNRMIQVRLIAVRKGEGCGWVGGVVAEGCRKIMVIKVLLRATSFSDPLLTQRCHHCIHLEKKKALDVSKSLSNRTCLIITLNYLKFEG